MSFTRATPAADPDLFQKYFPGETESDSGPDEDGLPARRQGLLQSLRVFVAGDALREIAPEDVLRARHALYLDWSTLINGDHCPFPGHNPRDKMKAAEVLDCLALAAHEHLLQRCPRPDPSQVQLRLRAQRLHVRPQGVQMLTPMRGLKSDKIGKLVAVRGSVIRVSSLRPMVSRMEFECPRCKGRTEVPLTDGKYVPPSACPAGGCHAKVLTPLRTHASTRDWQKIRLQEVPDENAARGTGTSEQQAYQEFYGRVPRSVEVELTEELVDCAVPGDLLVVTGLVKCLEVASEGGAGGGGRGGGNKPKCMYLLYIEALSVSNGKAGAGGPRQDSALSFSMTDLLGIRSVAGCDNLFNLLVNSLAPAIFGHEIVKAGLLLGLLGGTTAEGALDTRSDVHVLVVGDPGMGKSQMLTAAASLAPRGVYVCGNTSSSSGLTVTVVKDAITGDYALEAGALVMGDQGVCCIDEFDKMSGTEHQALLEAMEQQSISIAKAGIVCTLSARTSVLAAANPVGGHYDRSKTVAENLKLPANILSRFDLIFVLLDRPNEHMDQMLSRHVMALHNRRGEARGEGGTGRGDEEHASMSAAWQQEEGYDEWRQKQPLSLRLREGADEEPVAGPLLRKYIAYARAYCHPVLSDGARAVLSRFYLEMRKTQRGGDSVPITTRQLESLVRLAEARAKAELREEVTEQDAHDAVDVVKETILYDTLVDQMGGMGAPLGGSARAAGAGGGARGAAGAPKVPLSRVVNNFVSHLQSEAHDQGNSVFSSQQLQDIFNRTGLPNPKASFNDLLDYLNFETYILKKGPGQWKLASSGVRCTPAQ